MASDGSSLSSFLEAKKSLFLKEKIKPELVADSLAEALIEELNANIPGANAHPNATGNMLKALTTRSEVRNVGDIYWVGVGSLELLGRPGEKRYEERPIARFLGEYREEADAAYQARQERRAEYRRGVAERRAERERVRAERERRLQGTMPQYVAERVAETKRELAKASREVYKMVQTIALYDSYIRGYNEYFAAHPIWQDPETGRWYGYDQEKKSYQVKHRKKAKLVEKKKALEDSIERKRNEIMRRAEALAVFMQHWGHPYGPYQ